MINKSVRATKEDLIVIEKLDRATQALNQALGDLQARNIRANIKIQGYPTAGKVDREEIVMTLVRFTPEVEVII